MALREVSVAYALIFKDGEPFLNSISESRKLCIKKAEDYFGLKWKEIKSKGMRCQQININTKEKFISDMDWLLDQHKKGINAMEDYMKRNFK